MKRGEKMNRAKIQEYIDQREEQRVDLYHYEEQMISFSMVTSINY